MLTSLSIVIDIYTVRTISKGITVLGSPNVATVPDSLALLDIMVADNNFQF